MRVILVALAGLGLAGTASAATVLDLSVPELAERSALIFVGEVVEQAVRAETEPGLRIFTDTTFRVDQVIRGQKVDRLTISQLGGTWGGRTQSVPGYARFAVGERVVVFLERAGTGRLVVTGLAQGKYTLHPDPKGGPTIAVRRLADLHRIGPRRIAGASIDENRLPLVQLVGLIRGAPATPAIDPPRVLGPARPSGPIRQLRQPTRGREGSR